MCARTSVRVCAWVWGKQAVRLCECVDAFTRASVGRWREIMFAVQCSACVRAVRAVPHMCVAAQSVTQVNNMIGRDLTSGPPSMGMGPPQVAGTSGLGK